MAERTVRFRAATTIPYAQALAYIVQYARDHWDENFWVNPGNENDGQADTLQRVRREGLVLSGPDLDGVTAYLKQRVPGLYEADS